MADFEMHDGEMTVLSWKPGQKPNIVFLFLASCCCCVLLSNYYYHLYSAISRAFPKYDSSLSFLKSYISIWALLTIDSDLDKLAAESGVTLPAPKIPAIAGLLCGLAIPFIMQGQIERANILLQSVAERQ